MSDIFSELSQQTKALAPARKFSKVTGVSGLVISCRGLEGGAMGGRCQVEDASGNLREAEIVGFREDTTLLMPFGVVEGIAPGCRVYLSQEENGVRLNNGLIGRVINALGEPVDGGEPLPMGGKTYPLKASAPQAGARQAVGGKLDVGVRAINTFLTICNGQRMGIFSGSGVGKSVLMSMIARYTEAEVNVIGLVGERGREVKEFLEEQLGEEGLRKSVVVVATGDEPPLMRRQAAYLTMTIAEYFRDCGFKVMLLMDSLTRFALAQREIGLSAGEPPTTRGFTPSVFSELPRLLERAGPGVGQGSITAFFNVLVEGGDMDEPVADAVRGIVDGHIVMTRELAERGYFPAIDVLKSISRMVPQCYDNEQKELATRAREMLSAYKNMEELIRLGAYRKGSDPQVDEALEYYPKLEKFLRQDISEHATLEEGFAQLKEILAQPSGSAD